MNKIIDNITDWLVVFIERLNRTAQNVKNYLIRGHKVSIFLVIFILFLGLKMSETLYDVTGILWLAAFPPVLLALILVFMFISRAYKDKIKVKNQVSRMRLVGLNLDFNQRILERIYRSLTKYGYLDEELTSFPDFYYVLVLDFDQHDSDLHFNCTQPQLKYILDKFKQLKKGISLKAFERSQKIYHKGNLITAEILSKKYNEFPPDHEFEQLVDSFFDFLGDI